MPTRAAIYARVSSAAQRDAGTIDGQLLALRTHAARQGWKVVGEYLDDGKSARAGAKYRAARDGLTELLAAAAARAFDVLLIFDVDRLSRSDDPMERWEILGPLRRAGIRVATPAAELDLTTVAGELLATLHGMEASSWLAKHRERILVGKERALLAGKKPAGVHPFGYRYDRYAAQPWSIDPERAEVVREIVRRIAAGELLHEVADDLHARGVPGARWTRNRVRYIVNCEAYDGVWSHTVRGHRVEIPVPPLLEPGARQAALDALARWNRRGHARTRGVYLLEGLLRCARCASRIRISSHGSDDPAAAYVCAHRLDPKAYRAARCPLPRWKLHPLDAEVKAGIQEVVAHPEFMARLVAERRGGAAADRDAWQQDLAAADRALARLVDAERSTLALLRRGSVSEAGAEQALGEIARERRAHERQRDAARRAAAAAGAGVARADQVGELLGALRARLVEATPAEWQRLTRDLLEEGTLADDGVDLRWILTPGGSQAAHAGSIDVVLNHVRFRLVA